jgi:hypothetical protein
MPRRQVRQAGEGRKVFHEQQPPSRLEHLEEWATWSLALESPGETRQLGFKVSLRYSPRRRSMQSHGLGSNDVEALESERPPWSHRRSTATGPNPPWPPRELGALAIEVPSCQRGLVSRRMGNLRPWSQRARMFKVSRLMDDWTPRDPRFQGSWVTGSQVINSSCDQA